MDRWTSYREFWFDQNSAVVRDSETFMLTEIASYMKKNPSLQLGIDASMNPRGSNPQDQDLSNRRVNAIRDALVEAGVPIQMITFGAYGDPELRRDRRVEVLIATAN